MGDAKEVEAAKEKKSSLKEVLLLLRIFDSIKAGNKTIAETLKTDIRQRKLKVYIYF